MQPEVLLGGQVAVERRVLEDQADVAAHVVALGDDVVAGDARAAGRGPASVQSMLIVVVLPAPLGPRKPKTSPAATVNDDAADGLDVAEATSRGRRPRSQSSVMCSTKTYSD